MTRYPALGSEIGADMGLLSWLGFQSEERALTHADLFFTDEKPNFFDISGDQVLRLIPVYAAVSLISDSLASLPMHVYVDRDGTSRRVEGASWVARPDPRLSRFDWVHQMATSLLLRGNAYGIVVRTAGRVSMVRWLNPAAVFVDESGLTPVYRVGGKEMFSTDAGGDILHVRAFTVAGSVQGLSPVGLFQVQMETARSAVEFGHAWFENSAVPSGILKNETGTLTPESAQEAKKKFMGSVKRSEPVVFDKNWNWDQVSLSPGEAQFLETIKATATQIAMIFRVDPEDVGGDSGGSLRYSTVEGNQRKFNTRTLLAWASRIEEALRPLLEPGQFIKLNLDALARPNLLERSKATTENLKNGTLTLHEARALEDRQSLTATEIEQWQKWYATTKSESESQSTAESVAVTKAE